MAITFAASAAEQGVSQEDALNAIVNSYGSEQEFDAPRVPGYGKPTLFIDRPRKLGCPLLGSWWR